MSLPLHNPIASFRSETELAESSPTHASSFQCNEETARRFAALVRALCPEAPPVDSACLRRIQALLSDPDWSCRPDERRALHRLLLAAQRSEPAERVRDIAWPLLSREAEAYGGFARARQHEAQVRRQSVGSFHFDRHDWESAQQSALRDHVRQVREATYAPSPVDCFRVH